MCVQGFLWVDESRHGRAHKWGYTATAPGAKLYLALDTSSEIPLGSTANASRRENDTVCDFHPSFGRFLENVAYHSHPLHNVMEMGSLGGLTLLPFV
jgi:hypothetical protein